MNKQLTLFEKTIIDALFKCIEDKNLYNKLYRQYKVAKVTNRTFTGVGFYTELSVCDKTMCVLGNTQIKLGGIHAEITGLKYGAGFVLYINNGFMSILEGYCYDEQWPENPKLHSIFRVDRNGTVTKL